MRDGILEQAENQIKAGNTEEAGKILAELLIIDPSIERAWALMYFCVTALEQKVDCLKKILQLNPNHVAAKNRLQILERRRGYESNSNRQKQLSCQNEKHPQKKVKHTDQQGADEIKRIYFVSVETVPKVATKAANAPRKPSGRSSLPTHLKNTKTKEPHLFNTDGYKLVLIKPGENLYSEQKKTFSGLPEIDSGLYGNVLFVGGSFISAFDYPKCIENGYILKSSECYWCEYFSVSDCPLRHNPDLLHDIHVLFAQRKQYLKEIEQRRDEIVDAIYNELKEHGRPLHHEVLTRIIRERYPNLKIKQKTVLFLMQKKPEKFEWLGEGVFRAK